MDTNSFIGKQIGNYRVLAELNSGTFGSVYRAQHLILTERTVAIKLLHAYLHSPKEREQFIQEAQFLEKLRHRYIISIIDVGFSEGFPYLMAEYATHGSLRDRLNRQSPHLLPVEDSIAILSQIGQALQYAHQQNIIHCDLKPENILFNSQDEALLADFGIATMLSTASMKYVTMIGGTPPYMAPEQFRGMISKESDQYALGCIAYELFTGQRPFSAPDFISMGFMHATEQPLSPAQLNPRVPHHIEQAIFKAIAKQRSDRYADISSFIMALQVPTTFEDDIPTVLSSRTPTSAGTETPEIPQKTAEQWIQEGDAFYDRKHYEEALTAYEQAIRLNPDSTDAYHAKGNVLRELKRYEEALVACEQIIRLVPKDAVVYHIKGGVLRELGRYKEAARAYEQAIRLNPNDAVAFHALSDTLNELKRHEEALAAYEQAIRLNPKNIDARNNKGYALKQVTRAARKRPFGITIIAILLFISAVIGIIGGISNILSNILLEWFPLIIAVIELILARGLWTLKPKPWAYWGTLVVEIVNILIHFLGFLRLSQTHSALAVVSGGVVSIIIVIYLLVDRNVRRAFQTDL